MRSATVLALAASLSSALAQLQGFNYGATHTDGSFKYQADYEKEFTVAANLVGTKGWNAARLYTMIQGGSSTNEPTQAIPAAIKTKTKLLLGLWASAGQGPFDAEITALKTAIATYGSAFTDLVVGISVGSEDLYRISPTGIAAKSGYGENPDTLVSYIKSTRSAIAGTGLSGASIGHVDTWTAWDNSSNSAVASAVDWLGTDAYPYFQSTMSNGIGSGKSLFADALAKTHAAAGGKDVWITETGWPVSGPTQNLAIAGTNEAEQYWDDVACPHIGKTNLFWYTLFDAGSSPSFGVVGSDLSTTPLYDLSCSNITNSTSSSSASSSATKTGSGSSATKTGALSPSGMGNGIAGTNSTASGFATGTGSVSAPTGAAGNNYTSPASPSSGSSGSGSGSGTGSGAGSSASANPTTVVGSSASIMKASFVAAFCVAAAAFVAL